MASFGPGKGGVVVQQANRLDDVTVQDLDRTREYPIVKDSINTLLIPLLRAEYSFKCDRQEIADLAKQELGPHVRPMTRALVKPAMEFGWGAIWPRWIPKFDVSLTLGQSPSGGKIERYYPFIWTLEGFYSFAPNDTRLLINKMTGRFGGVRQLVSPRVAGARDILARECVHFVNDQEFDFLYGVASTKAAVPFVEAVESVFDSMVLSSKKFADPIKTLYYPTGTTPLGNDPVTNVPMKLNNRDLALDIADAAEGGTTQVFPSDCWPNTSERKWLLDFTDPGTGTDPYTPRIGLLNDMIRIALAVPQVASSDMPDSGTYNLGAAVINLLMDNIQAQLDHVEDVWNDQLMPHYGIYNFGQDAPRCYLRFRPIDFETAKMVMQMLLTKIQSGEPIAETPDGLVMADTAKYAEDAGLATITIPRSEADKVAGSIADRVRSMLGGGGNAGSGEPEPDGGEKEPKLDNSKAKRRRKRDLSNSYVPIVSTPGGDGGATLAADAELTTNYVPIVSTPGGGADTALTAGYTPIVSDPELQEETEEEKKDDETAT